MAGIWPGSKVEQTVPLRKEGSSTRAGTAVVLKPDLKASLLEMALVSDKKNDLIQEIKVKLELKTCLAGIYVGSNTSGGKLEEILNRLYGDGKRRVITVGESNGRHKIWDKVTNTRRKALVRIAARKNYKVPTPARVSDTAKGRTGESSPDLLINLERATVSQPCNRRWDN